MSRGGGRDRLVWSDRRGGDVRGGKPAPAPENPRGAGRIEPGRGGGTARMRRELKGRRGKTVTTIAGLDLGEAALRDLAAELKRRCGSGGAVKDGVIEIQGDHRDALETALRERGFEVKRTGG